jgi:hypothetical protein
MPDYLQLVPSGQGPLQCQGRFFERSIVRLAADFYPNGRNMLVSSDLRISNLAGLEFVNSVREHEAHGFSSVRNRQLKLT